MHLDLVASLLQLPPATNMEAAPTSNGDMPNGFKQLQAMLACALKTDRNTHHLGSCNPTDQAQVGSRTTHSNSALLLQHLSQTGTTEQAAPAARHTQPSCHTSPTAERVGLPIIASNAAPTSVKCKTALSQAQSCQQENSLSSCNPAVDYGAQ